MLTHSSLVDSTALNILGVATVVSVVSRFLQVASHMHNLCCPSARLVANKS